MPWVEVERQALAATLQSADPDAPTLCEGWSTRHLLAHLVQREQNPFAEIADKLGRRTPGREKHMTTLDDGARSLEGYSALLSRFINGPPPWSPMSWAGESLSFLEYVIHHEDIRRGGTTPTVPRVLPDDETQSIWKRLPTLFRWGYRRAPVGVTVAVPGGPSQTVKQASVGVVLTGEPVELALYVSGRQRAAHVEVSGTPAAIARFETWVSTS
jgi:uncharacterized protein (TIGR03085 family)